MLIRGHWLLTNALFSVGLFGIIFSRNAYVIFKFQSFTIYEFTFYDGQLCLHCAQRIFGFFRRSYVTFLEFATFLWQHFYSIVSSTNQFDRAWSEFFVAGCLTRGGSVGHGEVGLSFHWGLLPALMECQGSPGGRPKEEANEMDTL